MGRRAGNRPDARELLNNIHAYGVTDTAKIYNTNSNKIQYWAKLSKIELLKQDVLFIPDATPVRPSANRLIRQVELKSITYVAEYYKESRETIQQWLDEARREVAERLARERAEDIRWNNLCRKNEKRNPSHISEQSSIANIGFY